MASPLYPLTHNRFHHRSRTFTYGPAGRLIAVHDGRRLIARYRYNVFGERVENNPKTGRYITSEPVGLVGGVNTYAYLGGNPPVLSPVQQ